MEGSSSSMPQNDVHVTDTEAQSASSRPVAVGQNAANRSGSQHATALDQQSQSSQGGSNFSDSSGRLFSIYNKAAEDEDNELVDRLKADVAGTIFFAGLFSAAVAAILAIVALQGLSPTDQDISTFYLGNIYQVLVDPNATTLTSRFPLFSPAPAAIWVNSLWFLSLVTTLICALLATSVQQWGLRYIRVTRPPRCSPAKRARMHSFLANGVQKMRIAQVVEGLPALLHIAVFFFFAGLAILLFDTNSTVFVAVAWLIGIFSSLYGLITLMPVVWPDSPYFTPLSPLAWSLRAGIPYLFLTVLFAVKFDKIPFYKNWESWRVARDRYRRWILGGFEKAADEMVSELPSDTIDADILQWTIDTLGDDVGMENFFDAIPGFFKSKLVKDLKSRLPHRRRLLERFWKASNGFIERTLTSDSVLESVKLRRLDIGMNAISTIATPDVSSIPKDILLEPWDQEPQNIEMGYTMARWCTNKNKDIAEYARCIATRILATSREHNDRWIELATGVLGLSDPNLRTYINRGDDSLSLAILISVARRHIHYDFYDWGLLSTLYRLNIRNTHDELQHAFCKLWNDCVEEATRQFPEQPDTFPIRFLRLTRFLYIHLHQGTRAAPTHFHVSTPDSHQILSQPDSYPSCDIEDHRQTDSTILNSLAVPHSAQPGDSPNASPHQHANDGSDALQVAEELNVNTGTPPYDMATREMLESGGSDGAGAPGEGRIS